MANQVLNPPIEVEPELNFTAVTNRLEEPWWHSLVENIRERIHPENLPPLELTSKPVAVREIWGEYNYKKRGALGSAVVHVAALAALIAASIVGARVVKEAQKQTVTLVAPDISQYIPLSNKKNDTIGGGGGGGDRDKLQAPKGKLPKFAMEQITPPAVVVRNENPKLTAEPTVVVPPQVRLSAASNMPNFGDPTAVMPAGPPSNGTGSGGGIGGGVFRVGGGVSAPRAIATPDPEYSEEARKAKYQGVCVLWLIVGPDGRPRDIKVARTLGMGLDQKAIEAVRQWKFEPAMKDGQPVAVQINVEVNFRLY